MVLITNSMRMWMIGMAVSLAIFGLVYLTVIKPSSDTANQAIKSGMQQSQQALNQAQKAIGGAGGQASSASGQASTVAGQAQQQLGIAAKLTSCVQAAGTDAGALQACQAKYGK
jgi:hypothetical protein